MAKVEIGGGAEVTDLLKNLKRQANLLSRGVAARAERVLRSSDCAFDVYWYTFGNPHCLRTSENKR